MADMALDHTVTGFSVCRFCGETIGLHAASEVWRVADGGGRVGRGGAGCVDHLGSDKGAVPYHEPVEIPDLTDRAAVESWLD